MSMSVKDRNELRRILKARFQLLNGQLVQRKQELKIQMTNEIDAEYEQKCEKYNNKAKVILDKYDTLSAEWEQLLKEARIEGVEADGNLAHVIYYSGRHYENFSAMDRYTKVEQALNDLQLNSGLYGLNLQHLQLELEEELAVNAIDGDDAKNFLEKIPTIDKLLPLPLIETTKVIEGK